MCVFTGSWHGEIVQGWVGGGGDSTGGWVYVGVYRELAWGDSTGGWVYVGVYRELAWGDSTGGGGGGVCGISQGVGMGR